MSEFKSPFLKDKPNNKDTITERKKSQSSENGDIIPPKNVIGESRNFIKVETQDKTTNINNSGAIEIKKESQILKVMIVILVIALVLSLLGLILYNMVNKNKETSPESETIVEEKINFEIPNFEMKSEKFKAGSVVIE